MWADLSRRRLRQQLGHNNKEYDDHQRQRTPEQVADLDPAKFSAGVAGRYEDYSDFGSVYKPKGAIYWKVGYGLAFRGSVSQSFRAPNLPQFYSDGATVSNNRIDYAACRLNGTTCATAGTIESRSGNKNLKPEEADNATVGFVYQPTFLPAGFGKLVLTTDFWSIREKGVIGVVGGYNAIAYDYYLRLHGSSNPNVVRDAPVGSATVGNIAYINDTYQNLQPRMVQGADFSLDYDLDDTPWGDFGLNVNVAKLL